MKEEIYQRLKEDIFKKLNKEIFGIDHIEYETNQIQKGGSIWKGFVDKNQDFIGRMKSILFHEIVQRTSKDIKEMSERYLINMQSRASKRLGEVLKQNRINVSIQKIIKNSIERDMHFKELKKGLISRINLYITKEIGYEIRKRIKEEFNLCSKEFYRKLVFEYLDNDLRKKIKEEVDKIEIKDLKVTVEEYRELARGIKKEILEELREDLYKIKRGAK